MENLCVHGREADVLMDALIFSTLLDGFFFFHFKLGICIFLLVYATLTRYIVLHILHRYTEI